MDARKFLDSLIAQWRELLVAPVVAGLVVFAATFGISSRYDGIVTVQMMPEEVESKSITLKPAEGPGMVALGLEDPMTLLSQNIIEILGSREVAQQIVHEMALSEMPRPRGFRAIKGWVIREIKNLWAFLRFGYVAASTQNEILIAEVRKSVRAELVKGSYYMTITARQRDPAVASEMANAAADALISVSRRLARDTAMDRVELAEGLMLEARQSYEDAYQAFDEYRARHNVVQSETMRLAANALKEARDGLRANELALAEDRLRLAEVEEQMVEAGEIILTGETEESSVEKGTESSRSASTSQQQQEDTSTSKDSGSTRSTTESEEKSTSTAQGTAPLDTRQTMSDTLRTYDYSAVEATGEVSGTTRMEGETLVDATNEMSGTSRTRGPNPVYQSLLQRAYGLQEDIVARTALRSELENEVRVREQELAEVIAHEGKLGTLAREIELASDTYGYRQAAWLDAREEASRPVTLFRVVDPAVPPEYPVRPIKIQWAGIGALAGLLLALLVAFVRYSLAFVVWPSIEPIGPEPGGPGLMSGYPTDRTAAEPRDTPGSQVDPTVGVSMYDDEEATSQPPSTSASAPGRDAPSDAPEPPDELAIL